MGDPTRWTDNGWDRHLARAGWLAGTILVVWYCFYTVQSLFASAPFGMRTGRAYAWFFLAAGVALLPGVFALRLRFKKPAVAAGTVPPRGTSDRRAWMARAVCIGLFGVTVLILKSIDVSWTHYASTGLTVVVYTFCRLILLVYLWVVCTVMGALFLKRVAKGLDPEAMGGDGAYAILCFFAGAAICQLLMSAVGLLGLLHWAVALGVTLPVLYFAPQYLGEIGGRVWIRLRSALFHEASGSVGLRFFLLWCLIGSAGILILSRGLYPGSWDNDVWEHYLPYYRQVLSNGNVWPGEIWIHFYVTKGAGLFFLSGLLSDILAAQLISTCFIVMAGFILFRFLRHLLGDISWALLGGILFFAVYDGDFFKNHVVFTGYVVFLVWAAVQMLRCEDRQRRVYFWVSALVAVNLAFSQLQAGVMASSFFGFMAIVSALRPSARSLASVFAMLLVVTVLTIALVLGINYAVTGVGEHVPFRVFWGIADHDKANEVLGPSGPLYYLGEQSRLDAMHWQRLFHLDRHWLQAVYRLPFFTGLFPPLLILLAVGIAVWRLRRLNDPEVRLRYTDPAIVFAVFLAPVFVASQIFTMGALQRLYAFTTFFMTVISISAARTVVLTCAARPWRVWASTALVTLLALAAVLQAFERLDRTRWTTMGGYFTGRESFGHVLRETDRRFPWAVKLDVFEDLRKIIGPQPRVFSICYVPGPAYTFPGMGVVSEPSYTLGPRQEEIVFGAPENAKAILQEREINHFLINLRSTLFTSLVFSRLFRAADMNRYFKLLMQKDDSYVLTWREAGDIEPLPPLLIRIFELKQTNVLYYPFSEAFREDIKISVEEVLRAESEIRTDGGSIAWEHLSSAWTRSVTGLLRRKMASRLAVAENQALVWRITSDIASRMERSLPAVVHEVAVSEDEDYAGETFMEKIRRLLPKRIADHVEELARASYTELLGRKMSTVLTNVYKPLHFGAFSRNREDFRRLLSGRAGQ